VAAARTWRLRPGVGARPQDRLVSDLDQVAVLDTLDAVYQNVTAMAGRLGEADLMRPTRCTGLLGAPLPASWDDATAALKGTGREPLTDADRLSLGPLAARFPLFA
jgi:hypothetical protein